MNSEIGVMLPSSFDGKDSDELTIEQIVHGPLNIVSGKAGIDVQVFMVGYRWGIGDEYAMFSCVYSDFAVWIQFSLSASLMQIQQRPVDVNLQLMMHIRNANLKKGLCLEINSNDTPSVLCSILETILV